MMLRRAIAVGVALALVVAPPVLAAQLWTLTADTLTLTEDVESRVFLTATNLSDGLLGGESIGCIRIDFPSSFALKDVDVREVSDNQKWDRLFGGSVATFYARDAKDVLVGLPELDSIEVRVRGTATTAGPMTWTGTAFTDRSCSDGLFLPIALAFTVGPQLLATPTPAPTPAPTATPTPTPAPTPAPTPQPTASPTPTRTPTASRSPEPPPSPEPGISAKPSAQPASPTPSAQSVRPDESPISAAPGSTSAPPSDRPSPVPGAGAFTTPTGGSDSGELDPTVGVDLGASAIGSLGLAAWSVPAVAMSVPGLLLLLVIAAQTAAGAVWLPVVRRQLGGFGPVGRQARTHRPGAPGSGRPSSGVTSDPRDEGATRRRLR